MRDALLALCCANGWFAVYVNLNFFYLCQHCRKCNSEPHTAENLYDLVKRVVRSPKFQLGNKTDSITRDNASNFVAMVARLLESGIVEEDNSCACHTLQLSIKNALCPPKNTVLHCVLLIFLSCEIFIFFQVPVWAPRDFIQKFRDLSNAIRNSSKKLETLKELQREEIADAIAAFVSGLVFYVFVFRVQSMEHLGFAFNVLLYVFVIGLNPDGTEMMFEDANFDDTLSNLSDEVYSKRVLTLTKDIVTRWNSTFYLLKRMLLLKDLVVAVAIEYNMEYPSASEWKDAAVLVSDER